MPTELVVTAVHQGGMKFTADTGEHSVVLDYPFPPGHAAEGPTPLQMLLSSLAVCSGSTLALVLGKLEMPFSGLEVRASGVRSDTHPTVFTEISLEFVLRGRSIDVGVVQEALTTAEERLCPVWAMLKPGTRITASFELRED